MEILSNCIWILKNWSIKISCQIESYMCPNTSFSTLLAFIPINGSFHLLSTCVQGSLQFSFLKLSSPYCIEWILLKFLCHWESCQLLLRFQVGHLLDNSELFHLFNTISIDEQIMKILLKAKCHISMDEINMHSYHFSFIVWVLI